LRTADKHGLNGLKIMAPLSPIARRPYNYSSPQAVARSVKKIALKLLAIPELEFSVGVWRHDLSLLDWRLCTAPPIALAATDAIPLATAVPMINCLMLLRMLHLLPGTRMESAGLEM
jgi:hypothetical protein